MKKTLAIILSVIMLMSVFSVMTTAETANAIEINSAEDFKKIPTTGLDKDYILMQDITITDSDYTPIGSYDNRFKGTFDGNGKTITIDIAYTGKTYTEANSLAAAKYVGLFGATEDATIKNLTVEGKMNVKVGYGCIGGVVGAAFGATTIQGVITDINMKVVLDDGNGSISYVFSNVGGIVGRVHRKNADVTDMTTVKIEDCYTLGQLDVDDNEDNNTGSPAGTDNEYIYGLAGTPIGGMVGLIGHLVDFQMTRCVNFSDITTDANGGNVGGLVGMNAYKVNAANPTSKTVMKLTMTWCGNHGNIVRTYDNNERIAALFACAQGTIVVENCYNAGELSDTTGGHNPGTDMSVVGFYGNVSTGYAKNSFSVSFVDKFFNNYTTSGRVTQGSCVKNFAVADVVDANGYEKLDFTTGAPVEYKYAALLEAYEGEEMATKLEIRKYKGEDIICFNFIPVFAEDAEFIEIGTAEEFAKIGKDDAYPLSANYRLTADINVGDTQIGTRSKPFTGIFDGNGKTITVDIDYENLYATPAVDTCGAAGLFKYIEAATIRNLKVEGTMDVKATCGYFGGMVAVAVGECNIYSCEVDVAMNLVLDGAADPSLAEKPVTGLDEETEEPIYGDAPAKDYVSIVGGVVGFFRHNNGDIVQLSTVRNTVSYSDITVVSAIEMAKSSTTTYNAGGSGAYGGIVGAAGHTTGKGVMFAEITDCVNYGDITVNKGAQNIAGIIGMSVATSSVSRVTVYRCANYGDLSRTERFGDRVAAIYAYARYAVAEYCFNIGNISDANAQMVGYSTTYNRINYCFSLTEVGTFKDGTGGKMNLSVGNLWVSDQAKSTLSGGDAIAASNESTMLEKANAFAKAFESKPSMNYMFKIYGIYDTVNDKGINIGTEAPVGVTYYGYQTTDVADGAYNIRFVALVDELTYDAIGYDIKGTFYDAAQGKNRTLNWNRECGTVYTSLTANIAGTEGVYEVVGDYYIMALAITDVPASVGEITFEVTTYYMNGGVKTPGETVTVVVAPAAE